MKPADDSYRIDEDTILDTSITLPPDLPRSVADNDVIPVEAFLPERYIVGELPVNGRLVSLDSITGHFVYEPSPDFNGVDTFTYRVSTQQNASASAITLDTFATVTITVDPINDVPGSQDQMFTGQEDLPLIITAADLLAGAQPDVRPDYVTPGTDPIDFANEPLLNESNQLASLGISSLQGVGGPVTAANTVTPGGSLQITPNGFGLDVRVAGTTSDLVSISFAGQTVTFELVEEGGTPQAGTVPVVVMPGDNGPAIASRLLPLMSNAFASTTPTVIASQSGDIISLSFTPETITGTGSSTFTITPGAGSLTVDVTGVPTPTAAPTVGVPNPPVGDTLTVTAGAFTRTFELLADGAIPASGNIGITLLAFDNPGSAAARSAVAAQLGDAIHAEFVAADLGVTKGDVLVCCGGGGLTSGIALALEGHAPDLRVRPCEPEGFDDVKRSLETGSIQGNNAASGNICDAILTPRPGDITFPILKRLCGSGLTISEDEALQAMALAFLRLKIVLEPGGAASLASALFRKDEIEGDAVIVVASGGNVDPQVFQRALEHLN